MKDLCAAMGICWHEFTDARHIEYYPERLCTCGFWVQEPYSVSHLEDFNHTPADPAFCWRALTYMMGRVDWARFYHDMWYKYTMEQRAWTASGYIPWLLDPARFIKLANDWVREHEEVESD